MVILGWRGRITCRQIHLRWYQGTPLSQIPNRLYTNNPEHKYDNYDNPSEQREPKNVGSRPQSAEPLDAGHVCSCAADDGGDGAPGSFGCRCPRSCRREVVRAQKPQLIPSVALPGKKKMALIGSSFWTMSKCRGEDRYLSPQRERLSPRDLAPMSRLAEAICAFSSAPSRTNGVVHIITTLILQVQDVQHR